MRKSPDSSCQIGLVQEGLVANDSRANVYAAAIFKCSCVLKSLSSRQNLLSCYHSISRLQDKQQQLQERFGFSNITALIHSAQIDLQQVLHFLYAHSLPVHTQVVCWFVIQEL